MSDSFKDDGGFDLDVIDISKLKDLQKANAAKQTSEAPADLPADDQSLNKKAQDKKKQAKKDQKAEETLEFLDIDDDFIESQKAVPGSQTKKRTAKKKPHKNILMPATIAGLFLIIAVLGLWYGKVYMDRMSWAEMENLPGSVRSAVVNLEISCKSLRSELKEMTSNTNRINNRGKISLVLENIDALHVYIQEFEKARQQFVDSYTQNRHDLEKNNFSDLIQVGEFYKTRSDQDTLTNLKRYLASLTIFLNYYYKRYDEVMDRNQAYTHTYDKYYMDCQRDLKVYDDAELVQSKAMATIVEQYPQTQNLFVFREKTTIFKFDK